VLYSRKEIELLSSILADAEARLGTRIYMISDEVHRDMVWSGRPFHSPVQSYPRSVSIYSFGKAFAMQGQRIGYIALSPRMPELDGIRTAIERCVRIMGFGHPTATMQRAVCDLVDLDPAASSLAPVHDLVRRSLKACGYDVCEGDATFYVYVKSPIVDDVAFAELLASQGVLVVPSTLFHDPGYMRLSLTATPQAIAAAMPVFAAAFHQVRGGAACSSPC
jgi:aspartate aminotransferase